MSVANRKLALLAGAAVLSACFLGDQPLTTTPGHDNHPPVARFTARPEPGAGPFAVTFDASQSSDPDGTVVEFLWGFGDGDAGNGRSMLHDYRGRGVFKVTLSVVDDEGGVSTAVQEVSVAGNRAVIGDSVPCHAGTALGFACSGIDLVSFLPVTAIGGSPEAWTSDLWGWTDPLTGKEWALVGHSEGTAFVDLVDPENPVFAGLLPLTPGARPSIWRDIKVYDDHAFVVSDGAGPHGMQVFDLTRLRTTGDGRAAFEPLALYDGIESAHNIVINEETGFAYAVGANGGGETCGGGLHAIDIHSPASPVFAGCFAHEGTGFGGSGYTHDAVCVIYRGPDREHRGKDICFGANEDALSVADLSDKAHPVALATGRYPAIGYAHQGWLDEEHEYLYMNDEADEISGAVSATRTVVWDIMDLDDPVVAAEYFAPTRSSDHNLYVRGDHMFQSNYLAGLRIVDIADREHPFEIAFFDTTPAGSNEPGYSGSWSNYPYFASGIIPVSSMEDGVYFLRMVR